MTNPTLKKLTIILSIFLIGSLLINYFQYNASKPDPKAVEKAKVLDKEADSLKTVANRAQLNEKAVDDKTSVSFEKHAKKASKRLIEADKARPAIVKPELDSMSRDLLTFKPRKNGN